MESLSESAALTLRTLLGDPCPMIESLDVPSASIRETILNVIYTHKPYWNCYQYQEIYSINSQPTNNDNTERHLPVVIYNGDETKPEFYLTRDCYPIQSKIFLRNVHDRLDNLKKFTNLNKAPNRVALIYDTEMLKHFNYTDNDHPESPERISGIFTKHEEFELIKRCHIMQGRIATEEELLLVHTKEHIQMVMDTAKLKPSTLAKQSRDYDSVFLNKDTWTSACTAAGSVLSIVDSVLNCESQSGVAIVRPPGHHAAEDLPSGFCLFNNVAIAAKYAIKNHSLKRVLIVDWDIHHGNGTQSLLEDDPNILYISLHRYDNANFYPKSKDANYDVVGNDKGEGFNVNIPWNKRKMGNAEYVAAFQQIIMPIAYQFNPELILISAGFDACIGDSLGGYTVTPEAFGLFTHWLMSLANGRVILALEGGYNVNSIAYAMTMCTKALLNDPLPPLLFNNNGPCSSAVTTIKNVINTQKKYWPNLVFQVALPKEKVIPDPEYNQIEYKDDIESKIAIEQLQSEKLKETSDLTLKLAELAISSESCSTKKQ